MKCDSSWLPAENEIAYVASWSGTGAVCAYLIWAIADWLLSDLRLEAGESMQIGAGLTGIGAFAWVIAEVAFH